MVQIAASAMQAEWTVIFPSNDPEVPNRHERVICFAVRDSDKTVVPLIYDDASGLIIDAGELGPYRLG